MDINQTLDDWSKSKGSGKLRVVRVASVVVGTVTALVTIAAWIFQVYLIKSQGVTPTFEWFFLWQFLPVVVLGLPAFYGWYFADLGLVRNFYEDHKKWRWW